MTRPLVRLFLLLVMSCAAPSWAQVPDVAAAAAGAEELRRLVSTLEDEALRARLIEQVKTSIAVQHAQSSAAPDRIGSRLLGTLSGRLADYGAAVLAAAGFLAE